MLTQRRLLFAAVAAIATLSSAYSARATSVEMTATPFTGAPTSVHILMEEIAGGNISVSLNVNEGLADLRGVFFNIANNSLLAGLEVTGDDVTDFDFDTTGSSLINLHGMNLRGGGSPCPCDIGVVLGTPGIGRDDIFSTTFVLDATADLALTDFANQLIGVRVASVSVFDDDSKDGKGKGKGDFLRNGSAKLVATIPDPSVPVPEPAPGILIGLGLALLGYATRVRRRH
jgi:hypothetical protein